MRMLPADTSKEAASKQYRILAGLTPAQRAEMAFELSDNLRSITISGILHRHPGLRPKDLVKEILKLTLDKPLFEQIYDKGKAAL